MSPVPVILDVDPGHDDALALMLACGAPELEVRAVTTVAGNVPLEKTTRNALRILSLIGRGDVPVGVGAETPLARPLHTAENIHGESGLDGPELAEPTFAPDGRGAVRLMADLVEASAEPVTLVPTGPLTNVATFLEEHPRLKDNVSRIVLMGGSIGLGNTTPAAEFNIYVDPEAASMVFGSELPVTMVGLDVTRKATAGQEEVRRLRNLGRVGEVAAELATFSAGKDRRVYGFGGPPIHDAVAVAAVVEPGIMKTCSMRVEVERDSELTRGETVCDLHGVWGRPPNAQVGLELDRAAFFEIMYRSLGKLVA
ncbi:MAG: Inosine-uridine preferring nucleoside hydrolase [uncultured Rubrobacteraceae bacterium]|uniref:Inosine-uridine preferring nucleoside hydrolase n=1 Tax=uncultured Rubrobacteraceae bacterium TaxID=349277 RepID=A0A6J4P8Z1_9ACTN|nr:MAG: Inosine-uridine preferring nucleoside hydrolase [uncultured Rubrobacteraceae bacterium]